MVDEVSKSGQRSPLSVAELLDVFRHQVSVAECDAFAYPSIEGDIVVLVLPVTDKPTTIQVKVVIRKL